VANEWALKVLVFSVVVNTLVPVFAYAFTFQEYSPVSIPGIDDEELLNAGIVFTSGSSGNITFDGPPLDFDLNGTRVRFKWYSDPVNGDIMIAKRPTLIERIIGAGIGDYYFLGGETLVIMSRGEPYIENFKNSTIVANYDEEYNWTRVELPQVGLTALITPTVADAGNITKAVYETGELTIVIGEIADTGMNIENFIGWYLTTVFGTKNWGLPPTLVWTIRLFSTISIIAGVIVGRELLRL